MDEMIIAQEIADNFIIEWADAVQGINHLDDIFGYDHDLFIDNDHEDNSEDEDGNNTLGDHHHLVLVYSMGYGNIQDGSYYLSFKNKYQIYQN